MVGVDMENQTIIRRMGNMIERFLLHPEIGCYLETTFESELFSMKRLVWDEGPHERQLLKFVFNLRLSDYLLKGHIFMQNLNSNFFHKFIIFTEIISIIII